MPEPRAFKFRQAEERHNNYTGTLPEIDRKRVTAVLVRQSKSGADTAMTESRETQLGLQEYAKLLYGDDEPLVELYDEGAGVSGQKRIDQREELDRLYRDMHKGIIGTIVLAREDRIFRNKHMDQVGVFTRLAEEKRIKAIVPPISSASTEERTRIYDFTSYRDLCVFQDKMREAYGYIEGHVKHMQLCKQNKADKGGYDGRGLPPGFAVKGKKQEQEIIIYEPWAKEMQKLALRAQALSWDMGKLAREVVGKAYLFPEIPEEDRERYLFKTNVHHIKGVGYKPRDPNTLREWFKNVMYIGWFQPSMDKPDTITDHHLPILDYELFAEGYAVLTGYTLEGEPVERNRSITRLKETREEPLELLLHGKLLVKSPRPELKAYITPDTHRGKPYYMGTCSRDAEMRKVKFLHLSAVHFDNIVIARLKALEAADKNIQEKVKIALEQVYDQQSEDFVSIHEQIEEIKRQLLENAKKRMKTSVDDPMYDMLEEEKNELMLKQKSLEAKKERLGIMDSPEEIELLHNLLGNFDKIWAELPFEKKQRAFYILINRIEIEVVSMHWLRLTIDWLDALNRRIDVAYIWKAGSARIGAFTPEEDDIIRQYYPVLPKMDILKMMPQRSWVAIRGQAENLHVIRGLNLPRGAKKEAVSEVACYQDFFPFLDDKYLFGDHNTTLYYINTADKHTSRLENPLYAIWLLPTNVENLGDAIQANSVKLSNAIQQNLEGTAYAVQDAVVTANRLASKLQFGIVHTRDLKAIQKERELPVRVIQAFQVLIQQAILAKGMQTQTDVTMPVPVRYLLRLPLLRALLARLVAFGIRRVRVSQKLL
jgi:hypothetical protein